MKGEAHLLSEWPESGAWTDESDEGLYGSMRYEEERRNEASGPAMYGEAGTWHFGVTPSNVTDAKLRVAARIDPLRDDVAMCAGLSVEEKAAFVVFYLNWRKFFCGNDTGLCAAPNYNLWGLGGQIDEADNWEQQVYAWQKKVSAACKLSSPLTAPPTSALDLGAVGTGAASLMVIALIAAGVYVVSQTGLPRLWPKSKR